MPWNWFREHKNLWDKKKVIISRCKYLSDPLCTHQNRRRQHQRQKEQEQPNNKKGSSHKCTMIKMEEPPPFYHFWIRRRGLSSTLTCLSIVAVIIIACFLPIHPVNASSCSDLEEQIVDLNASLGMLTLCSIFNFHFRFNFHSGVCAGARIQNHYFVYFKNYKLFSIGRLLGFVFKISFEVCSSDWWVSVI